MENKKSFIVYSDWIETFTGLTDEQAGKLIKHIFQYCNDLNPVSDDKIVNVAFIPIKQQLKRDLLKWKIETGVRSESGRLGGIRSGEARRSKKEANEASASESKQTEANEAVTVNDTVNVSDKKKSIVESIDFDGLLSFINTTFERKFQAINKTVRAKYMARLKDGYTKEHFITAMTNCKSNPYHRETNFQYCTPEFFSRAETLDKYSATTKQKGIDMQPDVRD